jgi:hypothetical protein
VVKGSNDEQFHDERCKKQRCKLVFDDGKS